MRQNLSVRTWLIILFVTALWCPRIASSPRHINFDSYGSSSYNKYGTCSADPDLVDSLPLSALHPTDINGLLCFWDFQEPAGTNRIAQGQFLYALTEMNGPIARKGDGVFGPFCVDIEWGQWFRIERANAAGLNLHGNQEVTMVAWIKRESNRVWQFIAGMWDEGLEKFKGKVSGAGPGAPARQYALFISGAWQSDHRTYKRIRAYDQVHGYVSSFGGSSPGHPFAFDYATGATQLERDRWYMIAYTYDGKSIKVYVDGHLDRNENYNPFLFDGPIYDGGKDGADFTVGLRRVPRFATYPDGKPENEAGFDGQIGGLAIYDRALTEREIMQLHRGTAAQH